jgi:hypothetical protein
MLGEAAWARAQVRFGGVELRAAIAGIGAPQGSDA